MLPSRYLVVDSPAPCFKFIFKLLRYVVVVVAAEFYRVGSPWPEKIRARSGYVDPTVMETD